MTAGLYFRQLKDLISRISETLDNGVTLSTRDNLDRGRDYGIEVITSLRPAEKLDINLSPERLPERNPGRGRRAGPYRRTATSSVATCRRAIICPTTSTPN